MLPRRVIQHELLTMVDLPHLKVTLDNGLDVIVHENHECPIVAVNVWYHVGSKNERPGRTGFAHLFEHLMFEGSAHHDSGYFHPLQEAGGALNGSTNADRTNYWEVVPRDALDRALWMESDRMGYLLSALTQSKLDTQRDVVLNERRQTYENRPYGFAGIAMMAAHFPMPHPYHWPTIGIPDDIRAANLDDVRDFFAAYYHPANASLSIAGDVVAKEVIGTVAEYFGEITGGPTHDTVVAPRYQGRAGVKLRLDDQVELPRLYLSWPSPALFGAGDAELDLVADVLGGGKSSRLYRALVHDRQMATDVSVHQGSQELSGLFSVVVTAAPENTLTEVEAVVAEEIARVASDGLTEAELHRARSRLEADFAWRRQSVGGFGGISDQLNAYNVFAGTPNFFVADFDRYVGATEASLHGIVTNVLLSDTRIALSVVPRGDGDAALADSELLEIG